MDYAARSHASAAALVRSFQADAATLVAEIGGLLVEDADDEQLSLTPRGRFEGQVLTDDRADWQPITSPDDVAEHYDPVDLFNDVVSAIEDEFPGLLGAQSAQDEAEDELMDAGDPGAAGSATEVGPDAAGDRTETAAVQALTHLHAAGVLTDAEFEAKKSELNR
jgi:hypothetical protein